MNIGSVSAYSGAATQSLQRTPQASEIRESGRDKDRDSDDRGVGAVRPPASPTTNGNGQTIGRLINVTA